MTERSARIRLALVEGIGYQRYRALLARFGSAGEVFRAGVMDLAAVAGMSRAAATAVSASDQALGELAEARAVEFGGRAVLEGEDEYPGALSAIPEPPPLVFVAGRAELLSLPAVAIVGSRDPSRYGTEVARLLASGAALAGIAVVSGMARGLDAVAHTAALDAGGGTVGVLGNGFGVIYPAANRTLYDRMKAEGCLLTEFPPGERPHAGSFPRRNRLISGLARLTVVVEARERSGALITADCALNQGREVGAVPGPITSPTSAGTNRLIQAGARPILELRDILDEYGVGPTPGMTSAGPSIEQPDLAGDEAAVWAALAGEPADVDQLVRRSELPGHRLLSALTALELRGLVDQHTGMTFSRSG